MPMRKGENRFVVSKKKDRSLTSPAYKRRLAMEQSGNNTNFVPFVPFPPDYFAKKDKQPENGVDSVDMSSNAESSS
ncbi:Zinc finger protein var3, chloroplastic, partial [Stylosanthes scabra]|nr:Zinc finger protein var3, chloroplastic [Stylosanthes scabra]